MNRIGAIVQVRMSSERLPGKVLCRADEKPLLQYIVERLRHSSYLDAMVIATSEHESDQPIEAFCDRLHINCFRGALHDVAGRFSASSNIAI